MTEKSNGANEYPSAELSLNMLIAEYNYEDVRLNNIDTKAGILLAVVVMIFPACATQLVGDSISMLTKIALSISAISFLVCMVFLVAAVFPYEYDRFATYTLKYDKFLKSERSQASRWLSITISDKINHNRETNRKKMEHYRNGAIALIIAVVMFCVSILCGSFTNQKGKEMNSLISPDNGSQSQQTSIQTQSTGTTGFQSDAEALAFLQVTSFETCEAKNQTEIRSANIQAAPDERGQK